MENKKLELRPNQRKRIRLPFRSPLNEMEIPSLVALQQESYQNFLYPNKPTRGLEGVFRSIFPILDVDNRATIEYVSYRLEQPKYDCYDAIERGVNYASPLIATFRLIIWSEAPTGEINHDEILSMKEQDVYIADIPLMTESGTFIINGSERIVVSQVHRSPGAFYSHDGGKNAYGGKYMYCARIIPYHGSWLDFEFDSKDNVFFRIDKKRKLPITTLFTAIGMSRAEILETFYLPQTYQKLNGNWISELGLARMKDMRVPANIIDADSGELLVKAGARITQRIIHDFAGRGAKRYIATENELIGKHLAKPVFSQDGILMFDIGTEITDSMLEYLSNAEWIENIDILMTHDHRVGYYILQTLLADRCETRDEALIEIYKVMRPTDTHNVAAAEKMLQNLFFTDDRYSLSPVGRMKINLRHKLDIPADVLHLTKDDILAVARTLVDLHDGLTDIDDIDNLANRRVRPVGELIENKFMLGMSRIQRSILERMNSNIGLDNIMLHDLINQRTIKSLISEFFCTSQLSQLLENTNPLAALTNRRRISALGPGGFSRERIGQEVREINQSSYGRLCPIQTPEGPRVGLINSLAVYAEVNSYGLIQTPYYKVIDGRVTSTIEYLSAIEEIGHTIAQANAKLNKDGSFSEGAISCRLDGEFVMAQPFEISYIDVSPKQLVSVAASLIPFIENDDVTRALMGSNMQAQAVPLIHPQVPLVGTGMEAIVTRDTNTNLIAKSSGVVERVDGNSIVIRKWDGDESGMEVGLDVYKLTKYQKTNQYTCINQIPIVNVGDVIQVGDVLADTSATNLGELALGVNVLVAFVSWSGYNFEDAIIVSEKLIRDDTFSSIHIQEYEVIARDTKLGPEEITAAIPIESEAAISHLGESGIVSVGKHVKRGDILVGKVTPCAEAPPIPEEKLLHTLFGEKAREVRDTSLYCDIDDGVVIGVRVFTRRRIEKSSTALLFERVEIERLKREAESQIMAIEKFASDKIRSLVLGCTLKHAMCGLTKNTTLTCDNLLQLNNSQIIDIDVKDEEIMSKVLSYRNTVLEKRKEIFHAMEKKIETFTSGDDLPQGTLTMVKVKVAYKSRLQPGDKMSGRHGNKGVVSKIARIEDMPFLDDGTPVDILLNPLGIPSRMNIGQVLETHLGWASFNIGRQVQQLLYNLADKDQEVCEGMLRSKILSIYDFDSEYCALIREEISKMTYNELFELAGNIQEGLPLAVPVFEGATETEIDEMFIKAGLNDTSGQMKLRDGRTGEYLDRSVTVGYKYILKLNHLVDDKVHARSIGPYGLVSQQPLGGRSHNGGQRFGEMETWALEAYGAAYTLREMLTVKSDDVEGRVKLYRKIVANDDATETQYGLPESFKVILKELRALCLNVELINTDIPSDLTDAAARIILQELRKTKIATEESGEVDFVATRQIELQEDNEENAQEVIATIVASTIVNDKAAEIEDTGGEVKSQTETKTKKPRGKSASKNTGSP